MRTIALLFLLFVSSNLFAATLTCKVIGITDGDTFTAIIGDSTFKVRMANIDAPEKKQAFGNVSKQFLASLIFKKVVTLQTQKLDRNKRLIATVLVDGKNINEAMVANGYAWHYVKYSKSVNLQSIEDKARQQKKGLWQDKNPVAPWFFRHPKVVKLN